MLLVGSFKLKFVKTPTPKSRNTYSLQEFYNVLGNTKDHWVWLLYPQIPSENNHGVSVCLDLEIVRPVLVIVATWF